jgi:hypothetical protein
MPAKSFGSPNLLDNLIANAHFATALRLVLNRFALRYRNSKIKFIISKTATGAYWHLLLDGFSELRHLTLLKRLSVY